MRDFRRFDVWHKSHRLVLDIYGATTQFPTEEKYGLTSQLRRASSSIPINIAEGCGRDTEADFRRFLQIASGSASEVEYEVLLCRELGYLASSAYQKLHDQVNEVKRMLRSLSERLETPWPGDDAEVD